VCDIHVVGNEMKRSTFLCATLYNRSRNVAKQFESNQVFKLTDERAANEDHTELALAGSYNNAKINKSTK